MDRGKRQIYHFVKHNHKKYPLNMFVAHLISEQNLFENYTPVKVNCISNNFIHVNIDECPFQLRMFDIMNMLLFMNLESFV